MSQQHELDKEFDWNNESQRGFLPPIKSYSSRFNNSSSSSSNDNIQSVTAGMNIKKFQFSNGCAYIQDGFYIPKYLITMAGTVRTNRITQYNDWINDKHGSKEKYHSAI